MTKTLDPNAPVTRFSSLAVVPEEFNILEGDFNGFPQLTQEQIDSIPEENLIGGIIVYNLTYQVYMARMENRWNNLNSSLTYKGGGYDIGSPFALPAGLAADVEANEFNQDPGVMYLDTTTTEVIRVFINDAWTDLAVGGGSSVFENITVNDTATITNLHVTGDIIVDGDGTFENITVNNTTTTTIADITIANISTANITTAIVGAIAVDNIHVTQGIVVDGIGTIGTIRAGINNAGAHTPGTIAGLSGVSNAPGITFTLGSAAGTGATASMFGSPIGGIFRLTTGTSISSTLLAEFTLPGALWQEYSTWFPQMFLPTNSLTYGDSFTAKVVSTIISFGTSSVAGAKIWLVTGGVAQLSDTTTYEWSYMTMGNVLNGI